MEEPYNSKFDLVLASPLMNAAGSLGFAPDARSPVDFSRLGAFVTNPISMRPRSPAQGGRFQAFPGGFLIHTGYPNPGLREVVRRYARRWAQAAVPVIVHLLAGGLEETQYMVRMLEGLEGVIGIELGLPVEVNADALQAQVQSAIGELPVIAFLPFEKALSLSSLALAAGAAAVSIAPPRGTLTCEGGHLLQGRLYGPALFPQAMQVVRWLAQENIPVIGAGGVTEQQQVQAMLGVGALAVQVDAALWRGSWWQKTDGLDA
ncbi:MAG: nitronate monooxygenase [Anaerolineales bacterium]|jgi:dihydroorotate dehydrogenase (NAD+) catalytic subunit|nr:nitronate monooxygenase [Anaerolineales bacterium]